MKILLASGSFLKNFIMEKSRLTYEVVPADIDESIYDHLPVSERVVELAREKCRVVAEQYPSAVVVAADTLTANNAGQVFSKPAPGSNPIDSALGLSGQTIDVYTGCAVCLPGGEPVVTLAMGKITYQTFNRQRLEMLAEGDSPQIRSGALGVFVDAPGFTLIERIEGSYTGTYGLPMEFIYKQLDTSEA